MKLEEICAYGRPVWLANLKNEALSGWALYDYEHRPFMVFKMFDYPKVMMDARRYGEDWVCFTTEERV